MKKKIYSLVNYFQNNKETKIVFDYPTIIYEDKLIKESKLEQNCHNISAYCLSSNVASALSIKFANVIVAPMPNQASLISLFVNS